MSKPSDAEKGSVAPTPSSSLPARPEDYVPERDTVYSVLSSVTRSGEWVTPEHIEAIAGLGTVKLDFTSAVLPPGVTEVTVTSILGEVNIIIPEHVEVDLSGLSILGVIDHRQRGTQLHERIANWFTGSFGLMGLFGAEDEPGSEAAPREAETKKTNAKATESRAPVGSTEKEAVAVSIRGRAILGTINIYRV